MNNQKARETIASGLSWTISEKLLTEIVESLVTLVLARLLIPDDYGLVALVQIFINVSSTFVMSGLGKALVQNKNADDCITSTIFYLNVLIGIVIYFVIYFIAPYFSILKQNKILQPLLRVMAIKIPLASVYNIQHSYVQKNFKFKTFFYSSLLGTVLSGVVGIVMAYLGYGPWALVSANLTDQIVDMLILFISTKWFPKKQFSLNKTKKTIKFGIKLFCVDIISQLYDQLRSIVIGMKYTSSDLAYDQKGIKFPRIISNLTDSATVKVIYPVLANINDDKEKSKEIIRECIKYSMYILSPMMIGLAVISKNLVSIFLTDKWLNCVPYLQLYCLSYLTHAISAVDIRAIEASGDGKSLLKMSLIERIIGILLIICAIVLFDNALMVAFSAVIGQYIYIFIEMLFINKMFNYSPFEHIKDIIQPMFFSVSMGCLLLIIEKKLFFKKIVVMIIQILFGICYYILVSALFKNEVFKRILTKIYN